MNDEAKSALAMCWYDERQWDILKELDPDALDATYETWRKNATRALQEMTAAGHKIQKVAIKINAFLCWCDEHGVDPNAESRSSYAAWVLQHRGKGAVHYRPQRVKVLAGQENWENVYRSRLGIRWSKDKAC